MTKEERAAKKAAREASKARIAQAQAETRAVVESGACPICAQGLRRNLSLTGWWQCEGYGAPGFRKAGSKECGWQGFTE